MRHGLPVAHLRLRVAELGLRVAGLALMVGWIVMHPPSICISDANLRLTVTIDEFSATRSRLPASVLVSRTAISAFSAPISANIAQFFGCPANTIVTHGSISMPGATVNPCIEEMLACNRNFFAFDADIFGTLYASPGCAEHESGSTRMKFIIELAGPLSRPPTGGSRKETSEYEREDSS